MDAVEAGVWMSTGGPVMELTGTNGQPEIVDSTSSVRVEQIPPVLSRTSTCYPLLARAAVHIVVLGQ